MELHLLLMFSISTGFPIFHLVTIQQWHLTSWSTSSVLAEGLLQQIPRCSKGATCWSWNIPFWKVPVKQRYDRLSKNKYYKYVQYLQLFARCHFNANEFNMQSTTTTAVSPKSQVETMICSNVRNSNTPFLRSREDIRNQTTYQVVVEYVWISLLYIIVCICW